VKWQEDGGIVHCEQVTQRSRRKQKLLDLLDPLLKLQQAEDLHISLKCAP
jgi:hypothetical protein